jgi:hypothetical protein
MRVTTYIRRTLSKDSASSKVSKERQKIQLYGFSRNESKEKSTSQEIKIEGGGSVQKEEFKVGRVEGEQPLTKLMSKIVIDSRSQEKNTSSVNTGAGKYQRIARNSLDNPSGAYESRPMSDISSRTNTRVFEISSENRNISNLGVREKENINQQLDNKGVFSKTIVPEKYGNIRSESIEVKKIDLP